MLEGSTISVNQNLFFSFSDSRVLETVPSHCDGELRKLFAFTQSSWRFFSYRMYVGTEGSAEVEVEDSEMS